MYNNCLICKRISLIKDDQNPYFVTELETAFVVLGDYQFFKGYTLLLCKIHTEELHRLPKSYKNKFLEEMSLISEAVYRAFKPHKLNYELLGNEVRHLHWHIFPRYKNDPNSTMPIWCVDKSIRHARETKPRPEELKELKSSLITEINRLKV